MAEIQVAKKLRFIQERHSLTTNLVRALGYNSQQGDEMRPCT